MPSEHIQVILIFGSIFTGLLSLLGALVSVLVYFTRQQIRVNEELSRVTIPDMVVSFRQELAVQRQECREDHRQLAERFDAGHGEVMGELSRLRPAV